MSKKQSKKRERTEDELFSYQENLRKVMRDLRNIRTLIPAESSRTGLIAMSSEARAIIEARKDYLLRYIQIICDDNLHWGEKLLARSK